MAGPLFQVEAPTEDAGEPAITLHAQLQAGAGKAELIDIGPSALHLRVAAPPASGAADKAVTALLAEIFGVAEDAVEITGGHGHDKEARVRGIDEDEANRLIDLARHRVEEGPGGRNRRGRGR